MNKIDNKRYFSSEEGPTFFHLNQKTKKLQKNRISYGLSTLVQKQSQIDLVKKRISALCSKEEKYAHRTLNTQMQIQKNSAIKRQNQKIQKMIAMQRRKQSQYLQILRQRNFQHRAHNYFKVRTIKERKEQQARQLSTFIRNKSKQYANAISQQRRANIQSKRQKKRAITEQQVQGKQQRSRVLQRKIESMKAYEVKESEIFAKLEQVKDNQLRELQKLQFQMLNKNNASKLVYYESKRRLSASSRYNTQKMLKTQRMYNPQNPKSSMNYY